MSKLTINDITSGYFSTAALNDAFTAIETAIENTVSRDGTTPNQMTADLDMNSNRIINLPEPVNSNDPARLQDVQNALAGGVANLITFTPVGNLTATNVQGALEELDVEKQPLDATLSALAGLATGADQLAYSNGTDTFAQTPLTAFARTVLDDTDAATMRTTTGTEPTLLAEYIVTGAAVTSITIAGLDINTHKSYRFEIEINNPAINTSIYNLYINNDLVSTNYHRQSMLATGNTLTSDRTNNSTGLVLITSGNGTIRGCITLDADNRPRLSADQSRYSSTSIEMVQSVIAYSSAVANITQFDIVGSEAGSIGIGSKVRIYRGDK